MQDAGDDLPVVLPLGSGLVPGHERSDHRPLLIREPEQVRHRHLQAAKRLPGITKPQALQQIGSVHTLVAATTGKAASLDAKEPKGAGGACSSGKYKTISTIKQELGPGMLDRFEALRAFLVLLGDDVQEATLRFYVAFKRIKNFACVEFRPSTSKILILVKVDPSTVTLEPGFARDVSKVGHFGTGDLEITLSRPEGLTRAKTLLVRSYEGS